MDEKNYEYMKNKVERFNKLTLLKEHLGEVQALLVKDHDIKIQIFEAGVNHVSLSEKLPFRTQIDERDELMREIKDNLIDAIGMKLIEIEEKMKDL